MQCNASAQAQQLSADMDGRGETRQQWVARTADWQLGPTSGTGPFHRQAAGQGNEDTERERERTRGRKEGRKKMQQSVILLHAHVS